MCSDEYIYSHIHYYKTTFIALTSGMAQFRCMNDDNIRPHIFYRLPVFSYNKKVRDETALNIHALKDDSLRIDRKRYYKDSRYRMFSTLFCAGKLEECSSFKEYIYIYRQHMINLSNFTHIREHLFCNNRLMFDEEDRKEFFAIKNG